MIRTNYRIQWFSELSIHAYSQIHTLYVRKDIRITYTYLIQAYLRAYITIAYLRIDTETIAQRCLRVYLRVNYRPHSSLALGALIRSVQTSLWLQISIIREYLHHFRQLWPTIIRFLYLSYVFHALLFILRLHDLFVLHYDLSTFTLYLFSTCFYVGGYINGRVVCICFFLILFTGFKVPLN